MSALLAPKAHELLPPNPPGPTKSTTFDMLENDEMTSVLVEDATVVADEMQPGCEIRVVDPSLPAAMAVKHPAPLRLSIEGFWGSLSQVAAVFGPPPRLMLTEATLTPPANVRF